MKLQLDPPFGVPGVKKGYQFMITDLRYAMQAKPVWCTRNEKGMSIHYHGLEVRDGSENLTPPGINTLCFP